MLFLTEQTKRHMMGSLKTLCSAAPYAANSYSDRFAIVSDRGGEMIAIFVGDTAIDRAKAMVMLPDVLAAVTADEESMCRLSTPVHADS